MGESKEKRKQYNQTYYAKHKEKENLRSKLYRKNNRDKVLALQRRWRLENKEYVKQYSKEYLENNRDLYHSLVRNRRARLKGLNGSHTKHDIQRILIQQQNLCAGCFIYLDKYDVDHIIPLSRGGSNGPENLQILCPSCNRQKHAKTMDEWLEYKNRLKI